MHVRPGLRVPWAVLGVVAAVIVAGCSDDAGSADDEADYESPLAEYLGAGVVDFDPRGGMSISFGGAGSAETFDEETQVLRRVTERAAECMADQGFEYFVTGSDARTSEHLTDVESLSPEEFVEQYGYGISTVWDEDLQVVEDPNEEYRRGLSPEAREAYDRALYGDDEVRAQDEPDVADVGCFAIASDEIFSEEGGEPVEEMWSEFDGLLTDITSLEFRVMSDPRLTEVAERWRGCMADAGHPDFTDVGDPRYSVFERIYEVGEWGEEPAWDIFVSDVMRNRAVAVPEELRGVDPAVLQEIRDYEREIAVVDFRCMAEHYNETFETVVYEVQEQFIEQHRGELDLLRDWLAEGNEIPAYETANLPPAPYE